MPQSERNLERLRAWLANQQKCPTCKGTGEVLAHRPTIYCTDSADEVKDAFCMASRKCPDCPDFEWAIGIIEAQAAELADWRATAPIIKQQAEEAGEEIRRLRARETQLLERNNEDMERRRKAEYEAVAIRVAMDHMITGHAQEIVGLRHALGNCEQANERLRCERAASDDTARLDALEADIDAGGAMVLHNGTAECGRLRGLAFRGPMIRRTFREALDSWRG